LNAIDIVIVIPIAWGMYKGFSKGLIHELAQLAALIAGVVAGLYLSSWIGSGIASIFGTNEQQTQLISFSIAFLGALALVFFIAARVENAVKTIHLGLINRLLGGVFASLKFLVILSILINFINTTDQYGLILKKEQREGSLLYKPVGAIAPLVLPKIMQVMPEEKTEASSDES
jgi:membrane protein required for colicin V production